jgi:hypothetical protein
MDEDRNTTETGDEKLLLEIRENYRYGSDYWADARKERQKDMRYLCGDPWEPDERKAREDAGRPCVNHDELNQYVNQGVNNLRQNKRGIKIEPRGNGASDKTAELRQDLVRTIEYDSKAQSAYLRAGQDMFEGSYGFFRISRKWVLDDPDPDDPAAFDQEIVIKPIPNPDSVIYDPNCKEPDWSDAEWCFVVEPLSKDEFKRRFPKAERTDFSAEDMRVASGWVSDKQVLVAEYWKVVVTSIDFARKGRTRPVERKKLWQYITNGVEILEKVEQPGKEIPIPAMIAMERYVDEGSGAKRVLFSLSRLARDPQMSLAYLVSQGMEEAGMSPKVPIIGYVGQFDTDSDTWDTLNKIPKAYAQVDAVPDPTNPTQVLPLPQWRQFVPNFAAYEVAKDSCRRAVQAAMGISPLPTAAQRNNEKSGVALDHIQSAEAIGSYHFVEGYNRALERAGRIVDSWTPIVYDTEREKWLHKADDTRYLAKLNTAEPYVSEKGETQHFPISGDHQHDIGVSTGPSMQSQRDEVGQFLDNLIANLGKLPIAPPQAAKLLAMAIQMKDLGPKGDQMAEIISPTEQDQSGQIQQMQQQFAQTQEIMGQMQAELRKLQLERAGKVIENQGRMALEDKKIEGQIAVAEVTTKAQSVEERLKFLEDLWQQLHSQAHEAGMQAQDQQHEADQAAQQRQAAAEQAQAQAQQQPAQVQQ